MRRAERRTLDAMRLLLLPVIALAASCVTSSTPVACDSLCDAGTAVDAPLPPATYAPLVCDPAGADRVAFAVQETSAWFGPYPTKVYGNHFLLVDASCRFFVATGLDTQEGIVRSGVLTADELDAINAELLTGAWPRIDGEHSDTVGADSPTLALWRDDLGASCYWSCDGASPELQSMLATGWSWAGRLAARVEPSDGPVRVFVEQSLPGTDDVPVWTGTPFAPGESTLVSDPAEVAMLRTLRLDRTGSARGGTLLRVGEQNLVVSIVDEMPHTNEQHRLLPPFPIHT
jgi:hypothetical protein